MSWPFNDPPNVAVFTSARILNGDEWVYYVSHDADDGAWQLHPYSGRTPLEEVKVVSLRSMIDLEPRLVELANLPLGWCAWREERGGEWERAEKSVE
jgi:hypothetical protein